MHHYFTDFSKNPLSTIVMPYFYLSIQVARMKGSGYGNLPIVLAYCTVIDNVPFIQSEVSQKKKKNHQYSTLVLLPGKSHGRRSLVGCSP